MKSILALAGAGFLLVAPLTIPVYAADQQSPPRPMMGGEMMGGPGMAGGPGMMGGGMMAMHQAMCAMMTSHIEGRLAYIKAELKITDAQEALWQAYAAAARDNVKAMGAHCAAMMSDRHAAALSLPDRLDQHEKMMATQLDALRATTKSLKPLYDALSGDQKKTADQLIWGPMGMM